MVRCASDLQALRWQGRGCAPGPELAIMIQTKGERGWRRRPKHVALSARFVRQTSWSPFIVPSAIVPAVLTDAPFCKTRNADG
jgi:hypothetical protein